MRIVFALFLAITLIGATKKKTETNCVDVPRIAARKRPVQNVEVQKLELSEAMRKEMSGILFGLSVNDSLELNIDMEAPTEDGATQLEKMVSLLAAAEQLKKVPGEAIAIDLTQATHVQKNGKLVRTTISLTDQQLEKLLQARYGRKLVTEASLRLVYVHGLPGGTKNFPFGDSINVDLRR